MDGSSDLRAGGDATATILDRLDSIGRLLARGASPDDMGTRLAETEAHLNTRIDMLGRIVEQLMADREEADARVAALTGRLVDLEGSLAPALAACSARLEEAVPLLAETAIERLPGGGAALRVVLREVRDAVAALERRVAVPPSRGPAPQGALTLDHPPVADEAPPEPDAAADGAGPSPLPGSAKEVVAGSIAGPAPTDEQAEAMSPPVEPEPLPLRPAIPNEVASSPTHPSGGAGAQEGGPHGGGPGNDQTGSDGPADDAAPWSKGVRFRSRAFAEAVRAVCAPDDPDPVAALAGRSDDGSGPVRSIQGEGAARPAALAVAGHPGADGAVVGLPRAVRDPQALDLGPALVRPSADPHADALRRLLSRSLED